VVMRTESLVSEVAVSYVDLDQVTLPPSSISMASSSIAGDSVYDFWEAVTCAKCHLRFVPDGGGPPLAPFWITECGHVLCNNHLSGYIGRRPLLDPL
jgi:hypothetical protein